MSTQTKISISIDPAQEAESRGMVLVTKVLDPEIDKFEAWFSKPEAGGTRLTQMEREILRSYLYQKVVGSF